MKKQFVITMDTSERLDMETICKETYALLAGVAENIQDVNARQEFWSKIRKFNSVAKVFTE